MVYQQCCPFCKNCYIRWYKSLGRLNDCISRVRNAISRNLAATALLIHDQCPNTDAKNDLCSSNNYLLDFIMQVRLVPTYRRLCLEAPKLRSLMPPLVCHAMKRRSKMQHRLVRNSQTTRAIRGFRSTLLLRAVYSPEQPIGIVICIRVIAPVCSQHHAQWMISGVAFRSQNRSRDSKGM